MAAGVGYLIVYIPLMNLLFDKRIGAILIPIVGIAVLAAFRSAKLADRHLPRLSVDTSPTESKSIDTGLIRCFADLWATAHTRRAKSIEACAK